MLSKGASAVQSRLATTSPADESGRGALRELGQTSAAGMSGPDRWPDAGFPELQLDIADLLSDENGEVVVFNDSHARTLGVATGAAVVRGGVTASHVTAGGADVSGYRYVTFDNGLTLYFEAGLELVVSRDEAAPDA